MDKGLQLHSDSLDARPSASHATLEKTQVKEHILKYHLFIFENRPSGHFIPSTLLVLGETSFLSPEVSKFFMPKIKHWVGIILHLFWSKN